MKKTTIIKTAEDTKPTITVLIVLVAFSVSLPYTYISLQYIVIKKEQPRYILFELP